MEEKHFGEHFTLDGYLGDSLKLDDQERIFKALDELPGLLGMKKLSSPAIFHADNNHLKDPGGWTGFVIIMESHISIHTFPKNRFVSIDVYSCKNGLDTSFIANYFKDLFSLKELEINFIIRGKKYLDQ